MVERERCGGIQLHLFVVPARAQITTIFTSTPSPANRPMCWVGRYGFLGGVERQSSGVEIILRVKSPGNTVESSL
jgi:hypothetical protein